MFNMIVHNYNYGAKILRKATIKAITNVSARYSIRPQGNND